MGAQEAGEDSCPYLAAVAVYQFARTGFQLNLGAYVLWALNFNLEGQFYYVLDLSPADSHCSGALSVLL